MDRQNYNVFFLPAAVAVLGTLEPAAATKNIVTLYTFGTFGLTIFCLLLIL